MKTATQTILSSVLVIVMCFALITGATFALFSDDSEVNIAVNAGNVEVVASANVIGAWSAKWENGQYTSDKTIRTSDDGKTFYFTNGGKAYMDEGNVILSNITPGDGVQVQVDITNKSTVDIQYIVTVAAKESNEFFKALDVKVTTDEAMKNEITSTWKRADAVKSGESKDLGSVYVNIELPTDAGNELKGEKCNIIVSVVAYQANANVDDSKYVNTQEQLDEALANAEEGDNIKLGAGNYKLNANIPDGTTISGQGDDKTILEVGANGYTITSDNVTIKDVKIDGSKVTNADYNASIKVNAGNVTLENVTVEGGAYATWGASILLQSKAKSLTVKDCKISGAFRGILVESAKNVEVVVDGCDIDAVYPINFDGSSDFITVINSKFHGWTSYSGGTEATFTNVEFTKAKSGYNNVRAYFDTTFVGCTFEEGFWFGAAGTAIDVNFEDCYFLTVNGEKIALTAENIEEFILKNDELANATIKVNGVTVTLAN